MTERQSLLNGLRDFGLNPQEWTLMGEAWKRGWPQLIVHRREDLCFVGTTQKSEGRLSWSSINCLNL